MLVFVLKNANLKSVVQDAELDSYETDTVLA
jgi:hypothetical protein